MPAGVLIARVEIPSLPVSAPEMTSSLWMVEKLPLLVVMVLLRTKGQCHLSSQQLYVGAAIMRGRTKGQGEGAAATTAASTQLHCRTCLQ